ncbi:MAG: hypothetical protein K2Q32_08835 [Alphaproteobacteria bacterium]|nr:hypothetical protein [Alphaproteobacteria bacterium]
MPFSDDLKDNISVTPYIAFVALLVGGNLFVADLNRKEREAELARITDIVGERNIASGSIAEQFAFQFAKIVMPTITADNLHARHHGLNVVYAKPDVRSQTHVPVVIQSPTSLVSGSYFQINNGLSTETHHCATAHRIN